MNNKIEVAGDGQTAKATWISPGHESISPDGKLTAAWRYGKYGNAHRSKTL